MPSFERPKGSDVNSEDVTYACTSDLSGKLRGKDFTRADFEARLVEGFGWTPNNVQITCFDTIAESPYGALGDLALVFDPATLARLDFGDGAPVEDFVLGNVRHLYGRPRECCTRSIPRAALDRLEAASIERSWFPNDFIDICLADKRIEIAFLADWSEVAI
jgi:glutamine synthetase